MALKYTRPLVGCSQYWTGTPAAGQETEHLLNAFNQDAVTDRSGAVLPAEPIWTGVMGIVGVMSDT